MAGLVAGAIVFFVVAMAGAFWLGLKTARLHDEM